MKSARKHLALLLALLLLMSATACGLFAGDAPSAEVIAPGDITDYLFAQDSDPAFGEPENSVSPSTIYTNLKYDTRMFYGDYRIVGGDYAANTYGSVGYMDYEFVPTKKLVKLPYRLVAGKANRLHVTNDIELEGKDWLTAYFRTEDNSTVRLQCAYSISGSTLTLEPLKSWSADPVTNTITYEFTDYKLDYRFSFQGLKLMLTKDTKSVTLRTGMDTMTDTALFVSEGYASSKGASATREKPGEQENDPARPIGPSPKLENVSRIRMALSESAECAGVRMLGSTHQGELKAAAKLYHDGTMTLTMETAPGSDEYKTYNFVYFFCGRDGIIFTDGETVYVYTDSFSEYYQAGLRSFFTEDQSIRLEDVSTDQIKDLTEKKENLLEDLAEAFVNAGLDVSIDPDSGELAIDDKILFEPDSPILRDEGKEFLRKFIGAYTEIVYDEKYEGFVAKTLVEGHTAPVDGISFEASMPLSIKRAEAVRDYCLSAESGITPETALSLSQSMEAYGRSNGTPIYDANGEVDMQASRRVAFRFQINLPEAE